MSLPLSTITFLRTKFSPFSPAARPCRLLLSLMQTPSTINPSSPSHIKIDVKQLPKASQETPELVVGFKSGEEINVDFSKRRIRVRDVVEDISRVGRRIEREESFKGN